MPRWCTVGLWVVALGTIVFLFVETGRLAELAGRHEVAARQARDVAAQAVAAAASEPAASEPAPVALALAAPAEVSAAGAAHGADALTWARLELELQSCKSRLQAVTALLEERNAELARRATEASRMPPPMPEGVRSCLQALHSCLRAEGFGNQRFLSASRLDEQGLADVELLDADADGLGAAFVRAALMTATLDRAAGRLDLRFFDGHRSAGGQREELHKDGLLLSFRDVDGRLFEARLPALVHGVGAYADQTPPAARPPTDVDPMTRREWLARLERLIEKSEVQPLWRVSRFRGMKDGWFLDAELVASDERHHVAGGAHCQRLCIEANTATGVVSLLLQDGVLRRGVLESSITGEGYRILLPKLTPKQAADAMFGMVVSK